MSKGKRKHPNSFAGRGMKPRGNAEDIQVENAQTENPVSTNQVQPEGTEEAEKTAPESEQTPPSQEARMLNLAQMLADSAERGKALRDERIADAIHNGDKPEDVANLKPKMSPYISDYPDLGPGAVIRAIQEDERKRHEAATVHTPIRPPDEGVDRVDFYRKVGDEYVKMPGPVDLTPLNEHALASAYLTGFQGGASLSDEMGGVGPRPNGDLGVVLTIPEWFVTSVKDFAEADGQKSVEQWCSEFFVQHLEAYCTPMKGR